MFVTKPDRFSSDIIIPGRVADPVGFVTENRVVEGLTGPITIYFSVTGLRNLAGRYEQIGLVPREDYARVEQEADEAREEIQRLRARLEELEAKQERIIGLSKDGFKVQKQMGRPAGKTKVAA